MDEYLRKLANAPLADPLKIHLPEGKRPATRAPKQIHQPREGDLTAAQIRERKAKEHTAKLSALFDYYATTDHKRG